MCVQSADRLTFHTERLISRCLHGVHAQQTTRKAWQRQHVPRQGQNVRTVLRIVSKHLHHFYCGLSSSDCARSTHSMHASFDDPLDSCPSDQSHKTRTVPHCNSSAGWAIVAPVFPGDNDNGLPWLRDAPIVILDEPTSALDAGTEADLVDVMEQLTAGRTTIMIAHRLHNAAPLRSSTHAAARPDRRPGPRLRREEPSDELVPC